MSVAPVADQPEHETRRPGIAVLHVVTSDAFAGIERHVVRLAAELAAAGASPVIGCPPSARDMRSSASASGIPVVPGSSTSAPWGAHLLASALRMRPDVVHTHDGRAAALGAVAARLAGSRLVRTQHFSRPASSLRSGWRREASLRLHRRLNRRLDGFIAVSQAAADSARQRREADPEAIAVVPPGIALVAEETFMEAEAARADLHDPVVCSIGRLEPERRLDVLVRALPHVLARLPTCRLVVAGSGAEEQRLRALARALGVDRAIDWTGWVAEPEAVLRDAHVYVNTLPWEGFGMATAEAMASGLPVVVVDRGASAEMVEDEVTGLVVPPDDPQALAEAIVRLAGDRVTARRMGQEARRRAVELYGSRDAAEATLALYERLLAGTRA